MELTLQSVLQQTNELLRDTTGLAFRKKTHLQIPDFRMMELEKLHEYRRNFTAKLEEKTEQLSEEEFRFGLSVIDCLNAHIDYRSNNGIKTALCDENFKPIGKDASWALRTIGSGAHSVNYTMPSAEIEKLKGRDYRSVHYPNQLGINLADDGFRSLAEYLAAVADPDHRDSKLRSVAGELRTNVISQGVYGGYSIPDAFSAILWNQMLLADPVFMSRAFLLPMSGPSVIAPMWDAEDRSGGDLFGLSLQWTGENSTIDIQTAKLRNNNLIASKGATAWEESRELIADSPAFQAKLNAMLPRLLSRDLDRAFYSGSGVGQPLGVVNCASTLHVDRSSAGDVVYADIAALWSKLHPGCHRNSIWVINSAMIPKLLALKDSNNNSIWFPGMGGSVANGVPSTLFGREICYLETAPALGSSGDIALLDPTFYVIGSRQGMIVEASNGPGFLRDVVTFKMTVRIQGQSMLSGPITMENGESVSCAAVLNA